MYALYWLLFSKCNSFGVLNHSRGFKAKLFSDPLCFSRADPSWVRKRFCRSFHEGSKAKVPAGFHQGSTKECRVPARKAKVHQPRFSSLQTLYGSRSVLAKFSTVLGADRLGFPTSSAEGSTDVPPRKAKVPLRFHQGSGKEGRAPNEKPTFLFTRNHAQANVESLDHSPQTIALECVWV